MRKVLCIFFFLSCSFLLFADAGNACRYKVELKTMDQTLQGYIYVWTYFERFNKNKIEFTDYIKKVHAQDSITLYLQIKTVPVKTENQQLEVDLTSDIFIKLFNKKNIVSLLILEELEYLPGDRVHKVDNSEYEQLNTKKVVTQSVYNEDFSENCSLLLISQSDQIDLIKERNELENELKKALKVKVDGPDQSYETNKYLSKKRLALTKQQVILLSHCDAL